MKWPKLNLPKLNLSRPDFVGAVVTKRAIIALLVGILIIFLVWAAFNFTKGEQVDPDLLLNASLQKTLASKSYRFAIECKMGTEQKTISNIEGERAEGNNVHIKGKLINSPVEFVQYQDSTYMKDPFTDKWLTLQGNQLAQAESFVMEFNPLVNFNFKDVPEVKYVGQQQLANRQMEVLELTPNVELPFLENQFDTFKYQLWIDANDQRIYQAQIDAGHTANPKAQMHILIKIWDFDQPIEINPPV